MADKSKCDSKYEFVPGVLVSCTKEADHAAKGDKPHGCFLGKGGSLSWDDDAAYKGDATGKEVISDIEAFLRHIGTEAAVN